MHKVYSDPSKNRLYIILGSLDSEAEARSIVNSVLNEVKKLKHGFTCITDLRRFLLPDGLNDDFMQDCQEIIWDGGIVRAIRITPTNQDEFRFDFEKKSKIWPAYRTETRHSLEDAESFLDRL